ncbi:MAG: 4Fe-4S binding protein [Thermoplasmatota archaeon]
MREYERTGVLSLSDLKLPSNAQLEKGVAIAECVQQIPCNPCVESCPVHAISMRDINALPVVDYDVCIGCGNCVGVCPGLAIFLLKVHKDLSFVTIPFEFIPIPKKGDVVDALDRHGKKIDDGIVTKVRRQGKTSIITISVRRDLVMDVRNVHVRG